MAKQDVQRVIFFTRIAHGVDQESRTAQHRLNQRATTAQTHKQSIPTRGSLADRALSDTRLSSVSLIRLLPPQSQRPNLATVVFYISDRNTDTDTVIQKAYLFVGHDRIPNVEEGPKHSLNPP